MNTDFKFNGEERDGSFKSNSFQGFPGGTVVNNLPANAGDMGSSPGPRRFHTSQSNKAHVPQLLSLISRAHKPQLLSPSAITTEAHVPRARALQQEKPQQWEARAPQQRPNAATNKINKQI